MEMINVITALLVALGVPTITASIVSSFLKRFEKRHDDNKALKAGLQALLRHEMYFLYDKAIKQGGKTLDDIEDFENMYEIYHNLGANGVMDTIVNEYRNNIKLL